MGDMNLLPGDPIPVKDERAVEELIRLRVGIRARRETIMERTLWWWGSVLIAEVWQQDGEMRCRILAKDRLC